jgi:Phosphotransferase enzyme family
MPSRTVHAVIDVAEEHGIRCAEPVILRDLTNVLVHLAPAPVVARVPVTLGRLRGPGWEREVVALATFLAEVGAPIVRPAPELPPGPHERNGLVISFWEHVDHNPKRFDAGAVGRSLRELHEALARYRRALPRFERLDEIERVIDGLRPPDAAVLRQAHARLTAEPPIAARPLHGDVHFNNVLWTPEGPRWTDLENACVGPVEYDLAGLVWRDMDGTDEALAAYGAHDHERLRHVTPFLALFLAAWTLDLAERHPWTRPYAQERLELVRAWLDEPSELPNRR